MNLDPALLDELARVYAEAAVRSALSESQKAQRPTVTGQALFVPRAGKLSDEDDGDYTPAHPQGE